VFFSLTVVVNLSFGEGDFGLGPLLSIEDDKTQESQEQEIEALGPFITSKRTDKTSEFGFRPFFYLVEDRERDSTEFEFLYPIATYDRREGSWGFQFLLYILSYESNKKASSFREKEFTLFPLIFAKSAERKEDSYFALFPIYGRIKNKLAKDEINFFLFPLFLQTKSGETTNYSFLWPIFSYYTGGGQEGFRFWPFFGYRKKEGMLDEKFALWPIYVSREWVFFGEERRSFSIFPFYSTLQSPQRTQTTYLWPFLNHLVDKKEGIERWDVPWPLINFTRGDKRENRVFPLYAIKIDGKDEEGFFLWPLYRYSTLLLGDHRRTKKSVLFFLYSDIKEEPTVEDGRNGRKIDVWPLFSYRRDTKGNRSFHLLSLLEPFLSGNKGIERNYSSFWRLYEWKEDKDGRRVHSFLWNTFRSERYEEKLKIDFRPIIPIFSYKDSGDKSKVYFFGGLFGYKSDQDKKTIRLFFVPINILSSDKAIKNSDREVKNNERYNLIFSDHRRDS
jgi:hypothetical protein